MGAAEVGHGLPKGSTEPSRKQSLFAFTVFSFWIVPTDCLAVKHFRILPVCAVFYKRGLTPAKEGYSSTSCRGLQTGQDKRLLAPLKPAAGTSGSLMLHMGSALLRVFMGQTGVTNDMDGEGRPVGTHRLVLLKLAFH